MLQYTFISCSVSELVQCVYYGILFQANEVLKWTGHIKLKINVSIHVGSIT